MPGHPRMGKAGQVGIVDADPIHLFRDMPKARPKDQTDLHRCIPGLGPDQGGEVFSVL